MANLKLSPFEIKELIDRYKSELRKLDFQSAKIRSTVKELTISLKEAKLAAPPVVKESPVPRKKGKVGRPRKIEASVAASPAKASVTEKPTKPKAEKKKKIKIIAAAKGPTAAKELKRNHKLNDWDNLLLDSLRARNKTMINSDFWAIAQEKNQADGLNWNDAKIRAKLNQSLHKLANKRGIIVKISHEGKGFAYALEDWFMSTGKLPKKYNR